ncbi:dTDP-4-amino-4,6-dideoxygalactose transaminase [Nicoletella semolina]|uniref:dTDP-4-amino-4,6-dideoxygalactose transaminase n=1 Tax=Nicoletella semolina TaxID=271160 RepID=A0A4R2N4L7_9PAST|nr:dTDP-4-amino-4,6-dideoxygalactose transaminase [Nicoletella semolina]MDH2924552.1 dTDP-4-amino-4,6-dideoxygalactose transaminase [Nicoletella semolina]TCP15772.1 dTDP-4-amino-4,6-dideoxygalactose transaminase [Nicoletella semolina]
MIPFNQSPRVGTEHHYLQQALAHTNLAGGGDFSRRCEQWLEQQLKSPKVLLTPSCTAALEMAALLLDIQVGDEVIMPSYTFVSTANAFVLRGASVVFVDIRPDTMNIDEQLIEAAITPRTRAIVVVHYAGVACEMDRIMALAEKYQLYVVEDAAQAIGASYKGGALGSIGHLGCLSFHDTKNVTAGGEGGALIINDPRFVARAEIVQEKGTDRCQYFRGQVDKYGWRDVGSSYLLSELQASFLFAQLDAFEQIFAVRMQRYLHYFRAFRPLAERGVCELPQVPVDCQHNAHMFYLKLANITERTALIAFLAERDILAAFHYVPLHTSPAGEKWGRFSGEDRFTQQESERLVRLPLFYNMTDDEQQAVILAIYEFFGQ